MNPLVSVVIPSYNRSALLVDCIDSIRNQTYSPLEIIIADDGSTDDTAERIAERYGSSVTFIPLPHTGLPAVCRNEGIGSAKGEYIAFCDSDDLWIPEKVERQMRVLQLQQCNFVCSNAQILGSAKNYLERYSFRYDSMEKNLILDNFVITSSVIVSRDLLMKNRFSTRPALRGYEDYELWLRLAQGMRMQYIDEPLVRYRKHGGSLSSEVLLRDAKVQLSLTVQRVSPARHPLLFLRRMAKYSYTVIHDTLKKNRL